MKSYLGKLQLLLVIMLLIIISSCVAGPKTRVLGEKIKTYDQNDKLTATKDDNLANLVDNQLVEQTESKEKATSKQAVFVISGGLDSVSAAYAQTVCNRLNNDILNKQYMCLVYPLDNSSKAVNYLRNGTTIVQKDKKIIADLMITNTNDIMQKQYDNQGVLKDFPQLDVVMFLNGDYLYVMGNKKYKAIELKRLIANFIKINPGKRITIGVTNQQAKTLMSSLILSNKWENIGFNFVNVDLSKKTNIDLDIIIDSGYKISSSVQKFLDYNPGEFIPLTIDKNLIANTQKANPQLSTEDVSVYYSTDQLGYVVTMLNSLVANHEQTTEEQKASYNIDKLNKLNTKDNKDLPPMIETSKYGANYDDSVFGKSKFNFKIKSVDDILKTNTIMNVKALVVNTIGIKSVLVASRASDPKLISRVAGSFLEDYPLSKSSLPTLDLQNSNINDLLLGGLMNNKLIYHYGVINYPNYTVNTGGGGNISATQNIIITGIKNNLQNNSPEAFGPTLPNGSQLDFINEQSKNNQIIRSQEQTIQNLNSVINNIQQELQSNSNVDSNDQDNIAGASAVSATTTSNNTAVTNNVVTNTPTSETPVATNSSNSVANSNAQPAINNANNSTAPVSTNTSSTTPANNSAVTNNVVTNTPTSATPVATSSSNLVANSNAQPAGDNTSSTVPETTASSNNAANADDNAGSSDEQSNYTSAYTN